MNAELWAILLVSLRVLPVCAALVAFTRGWVGISVALSLGLALSSGLALVGPAAHAPPASLGAALSAGLRELCLGGLVALCLALPLLAVGWGARWAERAASVEGMREGALSTLYGLGALFLALQLGLQRSLIIGLHESALLAPLGGGVFRVRAFALGVAGLLVEAVALALSFGLPLLVSALLLQVSLALALRVLGMRGNGGGVSMLKGPLLLGLAGLLLVPAILEVPGALRVSMRNLRELTQSVGRE